MFTGVVKHLCLELMLPVFLIYDTWGVQDLLIIWYDMIYDVWHDMTWHDKIYDMTLHDIYYTTWYMMYGMTWHDMIWYMIWHDMIYTIRHDMICHKIWYDIFVNCNLVVTRWQQYSTHLHTDSTQNNTKQTIHRTTQIFWKSVGRAPSLRVLPWHLPYNWGKSTEKPQLG